MKTNEIATLLAGIDTIPTLPAIVGRVTEMIADPESSAQDLMEIKRWMLPQHLVSAVIAEELVEKIETLWDDASDYARLTRFQSDVLRKTTILSNGIIL